MKKRITLVYQGVFVFVTVQILKHIYMDDWRCISERTYIEYPDRVTEHLQDFDERGQLEIYRMLMIEKSITIEFEID